MTELDPSQTRRLPGDRAPGDQIADDATVTAQLRTYTIGLVLASVLTCASFSIAQTDLIWREGVPAALVALAVAQMGVHVVFFLHITTGPDNTNNVLALAFGALIIVLLGGGSLWIMSHLNHNMPPMETMIDMQR